MGKLSDEEQSLFDKLQAKLNDEGDDDDEVEITHNGTTLRGSFRRVAAFAEANGLKLKAPPKTDEGGEEGDKVKRFAGRRIS